MGRLSEFLRVATLAVAAMLVLAGCGIITGFASVVVEVEVIADWDVGTFTATGDFDDCVDGRHTEKEMGISDAADVRYFEFVCSDGTGSFVLRVEFEPVTNVEEQDTQDVDSFGGSWTVVEGTGDYTHLEGTGTVHVEVGTASIATYNGEMSDSPLPRADQSGHATF